MKKAKKKVGGEGKNRLSKIATGIAEERLPKGKELDPVPVKGGAGPQNLKKSETRG